MLVVLFYSVNSWRFFSTSKQNLNIKMFLTKPLDSHYKFCNLFLKVNQIYEPIFVRHKELRKK